MTLLPDDVVKRLPPLHTQEWLSDDHLYAYARLTLKAAGFTWFLLELHTDQDTFSAYLIDPRQEQFGYFSFSYLDEHLASLQLMFSVRSQVRDLSSVLENSHQPLRTINALRPRFSRTRLQQSGQRVMPTAKDSLPMQPWHRIGLIIMPPAFLIMRQRNIRLFVTLC